VIPYQCPVCEQLEIADLLQISDIPIHCNLLWNTRAEATLAPRGDIYLSFCRTCGHVFNRAFEPVLMEYSQAYENSLHFSPQFRQYVTKLAKQLVERHNLRNKSIIEIGSGQGDFLKLLCILGDNRGVGFDPSYVPDQPDPSTNGRVTFVQDYYSPQYTSARADFICSRHVLEHIYQPAQFIHGVRQAVGDRTHTTIFFEVPNVLYTLRDLGIWDLIYEHYSYFSPTSLTQLFSRNNFEIIRLAEVYAGQFLTIEAQPTAGVGAQAHAADALVEMTALTAAFADKYRHKVQMWRDKLLQMTTAGQRIVVWGGGSKGVTFLNILKTQDRIEFVVDINPRKQGKYVAGTGQLFVPPDFLRRYHPDVVIVMNPIYLNEIQHTVADLELAPQFLSV